MISVLRYKIALICVIVLSLAGCATSTISLSVNEIRAINIARIEIEYAEDMGFSWEKEELAYVEQVKSSRAPASEPKPWQQVSIDDKKGTTSEYDEIVKSPEGQQHLRNVLEQKLREKITAKLVPEFQGTRPVILSLEIKAFIIPGPVQRAVLGGAPVLVAVTTLKDADTNKELAKLDRASAGQAGNGLIGVLVDQGFDDLEDRVLDAYIENLRQWLYSGQDDS